MAKESRRLQTDWFGMMDCGMKMSQFLESSCSCTLILQKARGLSFDIADCVVLGFTRLKAITP